MGMVGFGVFCLGYISQIPELKWLGLGISIAFPLQAMTPKKEKADAEAC